ncbi:MAG: Do family serine endopeptidase [Opitutaceae bacterium]
MKIKILFVFVSVMLGFYGLNVFLGAKEGGSAMTSTSGSAGAGVSDVGPAIGGASSEKTLLDTGSVDVEKVIKAGKGERSAVVLVDRTPIEHGKSTVVTSYADGLEAVRPAVVSVYSTKTVNSGGGRGFPFDDPMFRRFFGPGFDQQQERIQRGLGSGVVISADGYILTNNHVVEEADEVKVGLGDGRELVAEVIGTDPRTDVAVLKVEATDLPHVTLADSDALRVGDVVFAVGNPLGVGQTVTMGIVSATGRSNLQLLDGGYENFIQTDASINPGNSGGALVDALGRVVGINTAIISTSRGNIGIGFAIPVNLASSIMQSLIETGTVSRGFLGVSIQDMDSELASEFGLGDTRGALVVQVSEDSPADEAGLERGDVLISVNGKSVGSTAELRLLISQSQPGSTVTVGYMRSGEKREARVVLGKLDEETVAAGPSRNQDVIPGVRLLPVDDETRGQFQIPDEVDGLIVAAIEPGSRYAESFPVGTVIEQINRKAVKSLDDAREALVEGRNLLYVSFRGVYRYVTITIPKE